MSSKQSGRPRRRAALSKKAIQQWLGLWFPGARVQRVSPLGDGVTAKAVGVDYRVAGRSQRSVLRLVDGPIELCWRESLLLNNLHAAELPVSACHGVKQQDGMTCMLLDWLPGKKIFRPIDIAPYAEQAAELMARIHATPMPQRMRRFDTGFSKQVAGLRNNFPQFSRISDGLAGGLPAAQDRVLLHGDFWPGNLLYRRKELTGIVDWSDAAAGCPMADVSNARFELRWLWGKDAMQAFTEHYFAKAPYRAAELATWDLVALVKPILGMHRWGLSDAHQRRILQTVNAVADEALLARNA